jgi:hypothetical protein
MRADVTPKFAFRMVLSRQIKPFLFMSQKLCALLYNPAFFSLCDHPNTGVISGNLFKNAHSIYTRKLRWTAFHLLNSSCISNVEILELCCAHAISQFGSFSCKSIKLARHGPGDGDCWRRWIGTILSLWQIQKTPKLHRRNERVSEFTYYAPSPRVSIPGECVGSILYVCTKVVMRQGRRAS